MKTQRIKKLVRDQKQLHFVACAALSQRRCFCPLVKRAREQHLESLAGLPGPLMKQEDAQSRSGILTPWPCCVSGLAEGARCSTALCPWRLVVLYSHVITPGNQPKPTTAKHRPFTERSGLGREVMWFTLTSIRSKEETRLGGRFVLRLPPSRAR